MDTIPKKRFPTELIALAAIAFLVGAVFVVGALKKRGYISTHRFQTLTGSAPARVSVLNIGKGKLKLTGTLLDGTEKEDPKTAGLETEVGEQRSFLGLQPGRYRLEFSDALANDLGGCVLKVDGGGSFDFVASDRGIIVIQDGKRAETFVELDIKTSSVCSG